jgi:ribose transport system substrate-binding protein
MKRDLHLLVAIAVILTMVMVGCRPQVEAPEAEAPEAEAPEAEAPEAEALESLTIAWIPKALNNPVFEVGRDGAFKKAEELTAETGVDVTVEYVGSVASDATEQARVVEDVIARGVDAIGISCNDPTACEDPINKAVEAGIPVMTWDSDSPDSQRFTYLGVDNYEGGKAAAELLVQFMGEEGKVALLTGVPGAFNLEERIRGFQDGVADYPGIEIVSTVYCNDDINLGVQVIEETMQAHPDLDGWFLVGLWPLFADRGSMPLWEEAALDGGLVTIAFDTLPVELEFMQDGYLQGLVGQKYWGWGYDTVQMVYDYIVEGAEYEDWTDSGMDIVTECNVDIMAEMWASSDFTQDLPDPYACLEGGAEAEGPESLTIAWIPKALNNPVFEVGRDGAFKKAEELTAETGTEVTVEYVGSVASDAAEQARVVEDVIARGVDAIGISCNDPTACEDPINKAVEAGIPVMTWDSDSPDSQRFTYLGVDNYEGGKAAAELLVQFMGEEGKVALLTGVPGAFNLEERIRGFQDGVADYPGIEIVSTVYCNDDINLGVQVVEETMQAHPDLNGWFFVGLWPLFADRGSMPLWEDAALNSGLVTIAFDTLPVELEFMQDGYLQGLVGQKYWGWGYDTVQMIYDFIVKGTTYEDWTDSGMDIVTECNVDIMAEMWASSDFTQALLDPYACLE